MSTPADELAAFETELAAAVEQLDRAALMTLEYSGVLVECLQLLARMYRDQRRVLIEDMPAPSRDAVHEVTAGMLDRVLFDPVVFLFEIAARAADAHHERAEGTYTVRPPRRWNEIGVITRG